MYGYYEIEQNVIYLNTVYKTLIIIHCVYNIVYIIWQLDYISIIL